MDKTKKNIFVGIIFSVIIVLILSIVVASPATLFASDGTTNFGTINQEITNFYNITINLTSVGISGNVTEVNITLPYGFTFTNGTNGTNGDSIGPRASILFNNTGSVLTWNSTHFVINSSFTNATAQYGTGNLTSFIFNATGAHPGVYNFTVSLRNSTTVTTYSYLNVSINDTTAPNVTSSVSTSAANSLVLTVAAADNHNVTSLTCASDRAGTGNTAFTNTNTTSQTLTETGLNCGSSYAYIFTCYDSNTNTGTSTSLTAYTRNCTGGGSASVGGTSTSTTATMTYSPQKSDLETGYQKSLAVKERVKVMVGTSAHYVEVKTIGTSSATIEIASDPVTIDLDVGEDAKVDVDSDGDYDVYVKLNAITSGKADVTIQTISEAVPEGESGVSTSGEAAGNQTGTTGEVASEGKDLTWLWIVIAIVILIALGVGMSKKRK